MRGTVREVLGMLVGSVLAAAASVSCGAGGLAHRAQYGTLPVAGFSESLGIARITIPEPDLGTEDVRVLGDGLERVNQLSGYFQEWCLAQHGQVDAGERAKSLSTAANEYREQQSKAASNWGLEAECVNGEGAVLGAYITLNYSFEQRVAFYTADTLKPFVDKYEPAGLERVAKAKQAEADREAELARAHAEEEQIVATSGVGGTSIAETLEIMDRARHDDMRGILAGIGHKSPCLLVIGGTELKLKTVHVDVHEKETMTIVNALTQEMGTRVTYVLDVMDGSAHAAVEFAGASTADLNAHGVEHLAQLCGAPH